MRRQVDEITNEKSREKETALGKMDSQVVGVVSSLSELEYKNRYLDERNRRLEVENVGYVVDENDPEVQRIFQDHYATW